MLITWVLCYCDGVECDKVAQHLRDASMKADAYHLGVVLLGWSVMKWRSICVIPVSKPRLITRICVTVTGWSVIVAQHLRDASVKA